MKKYYLFSAILLLISGSAFSQTTNWYFGNQGGLKFTGSGTSTSPGSVMSTNEGCTGVTDASGNVIFYADGESLWDGNHNLITNNMLGGASSTQAALVVPVPGDYCSKFLVFTTPGSEVSTFSNGLGVTLITVSGSSFPYTVTASTSEQLVPGTTFAEKLACTPDNSGGYWLVAHDYVTGSGTANSFYVYHVTSSLMTSTTTLQAVNDLNSNISIVSAGLENHNESVAMHYDAQGQMKFNKTGSQLAYVLGGRRVVEVFDFNKITGAITFNQNIAISNPQGNTYGLEFSPSGQYLYIAESFSTSNNNRHIYQIDLSSTNQVPIATANSPGYYTFNALQLGPDDRIYIAGPGLANTTLSVLNSPDMSTPGYSANSVSISGTSGLGLPTVITSQKSCPEQPPLCSCEGSITLESSDLNKDGTASANFIINSGGFPVKSIKATISGWNSSLTSNDCKNYCDLGPQDMGTFTNILTSPVGFTGQFGEFAPGASGNFAYEVNYTTSTPGAINQESISLQLKFPPILNLECCDQTINYCIRFELYDEACKVCEYQVCVESSSMAEEPKSTTLKKNFFKTPTNTTTKQKPTSLAKVIPNPNKGDFSIDAGTNEATNYEIISTNGSIIKSGRLLNGKASVSGLNLQSGTYHVVITGKERISTTFVVQ